MAIHWARVGLTTGGNTGDTPTDAFQTLSAALTHTYAIGDILVFCRDSLPPTATVSLSVASNNNGDLRDFVKITRYPFPEETGTGDFIKGSKAVTGVVLTSGLYPSKGRHIAREIKNDSLGVYHLISAILYRVAYDAQTVNFTEGSMLTGGTSGAIGKIHKITDNGTTGYLWVVLRNESTLFSDNETITDAAGGSASVNGTTTIDGFLMRKKHIGATATGAAFTIKKDVMYDTIYAADTTWDSIAPNSSPQIYFGVSTLFLNMSGPYMWKWYGIHFIDVNFRITSVSNTILENCYWENNLANVGFMPRSTAPRYFLRHCVFKGHYSVGNTNVGIEAYNAGELFLENCSLYNFNSYALNCDAATVHCKGVDMGVVLPNATYNISNGAIDQFWEDIEFGSTGTSMVSQGMFYRGSVNIQGYNGSVSTLMTFFANRSTMWNLPVVYNSGDPYRRPGGSAEILALKLTNDQIGETGMSYENNDVMLRLTHPRIPITKYNRGITTKYRFYVQLNGFSLASGALKVVARYTSHYENDTLWLKSDIEGTSAIAARTSVSDWSQYIEVEVPAIRPELIEFQILYGGHTTVTTAMLYLDLKPEEVY